MGPKRGQPKQQRQTDKSNTITSQTIHECVSGRERERMTEHQKPKCIYSDYEDIFPESESTTKPAQVCDSCTCMSHRVICLSRSPNAKQSSMGFCFTFAVWKTNKNGILGAVYEARASPFIINMIVVAVCFLCVFTLFIRGDCQSIGDICCVRFETVACTRNINYPMVLAFGAWEISSNHFVFANENSNFLGLELNSAQFAPLRDCSRY